MACWAPAGLRLAFSRLLVVAFTVIVESACRSVSVEFNVLSAAATPVPAAAAGPVQQGVSSTTLAIAPKPTADATVPAPSTAPSGLSFAPHGVSDTASGTIASQDQRDSFPFQGTQGQFLELRVKRTSGVTLMPRMELLDPSGANEVKPPYSTGPEVQIERTLPSTGAYTIAVSAFTGTGPYSVAWSLDRFGQLANDEQVSAALVERLRTTATDSRESKVKL